MRACYTKPMITNIDALIHLPRVNAGPWTRFSDCYERRVSFTCDHIRRYALLKVYIDDEGTTMIFVRLDGVVRKLSVGEYVDPFSTADETLLALSDECYCHTEQNGESL